MKLFGPKPLAPAEALDIVIKRVQRTLDSSNWTCTQGNKAFTRRTSDFKFEILFHTSHKNRAESIEIMMEGRVYCRKLPEQQLQGILSNYSYFDDESYWWDISSARSAGYVADTLISRLKQDYLPLVERFIHDFDNLLQEIAEYGISDHDLYFLGHYGNQELVEKRVLTYYQQLSDKQRDTFHADMDVVLSGRKLSKGCMLNPVNFKYIAENGLMSVIDRFCESGDPEIKDFNNRPFPCVGSPQV